MNKEMFSKSYDLPKAPLSEDTDRITTELPQAVEVKLDTFIQCPRCRVKTTIIFASAWGPYAIAFHNEKLWISKTQYVEAECSLSGSEIKVQLQEEKAPNV